MSTLFIQCIWNRLSACREFCGVHSWQNGKMPLLYICGFPSILPMAYSTQTLKNTELDHDEIE